MSEASDIERLQVFAQSALSLTPTIILGSGASAAHGLATTGAVALHLLSLPEDEVWIEAEVEAWAQLKRALQGGKDLESALQAVKLTDRQTQLIVGETRKLLFPADLAILENLLSNRNALPLSRLFRHLFASTHRTLDVVTPNYDRLAEYAADAADYRHFNGFTSGYLQTRETDPRTKASQGIAVERTVCVWKVHGSLEWFRDSAGQIVSSPPAHTVPTGFTPVMITPGVDKYRQAYAEPFRTIFGCADSALERARSYLCIGYGFNDEHLQTKLVERCEAHSVPLMVLAKSLTDSAKAFLSSGRCRKYLALEEDGGGTRWLSSEFPGSGTLPGLKIWRLADFLDFTTGG